MRFMLRLGLWCFNVTFNNISVISWRSVLLAEVSGVPGENHRAVVSHRQSLSPNVGIRNHNFSGDRH